MSKPTKLIRRSQRGTRKWRRFYQVATDASHEDAMDYPEPPERRVELNGEPAE